MKTPEDKISYLPLTAGDTYFNKITNQPVKAWWTMLEGVQNVFYIKRTNNLSQEFERPETQFLQMYFTETGARKRYLLNKFRKEKQC